MEEKSMMITRRQMIATMASGFSGLLGPDQSSAASPTDFSGKTLRMLVGTGPGAAYDLIARLVLEYLMKTLPGQPKGQVEHIVGAGSLVMANYLGARAVRDGTVMGLPLNSIILEPSLKLLSRGGGAVQFNIDALNWLGSPCEIPPVFFVMNDTPFQTFDDIRSKTIIVGASQPGADNYILSLMSQRLLGGKLSIVPGYTGANDIFLAAERGEIQGGCTAYSTIVVGRPDWIKSGRVRIIAQYGAKRISTLPNAPTGIELADDTVTKKMFEVLSAKFKAAYPFMLPPNVPAPTMETLRRAFDATMSNLDFTSSIQKFGVETTPTSGSDILKLVKEANAAPKNVIDALRNAIEL